MALIRHSRYTLLTTRWAGLLLLLLWATVVFAQRDTYSALWGRTGERYDSTRLPDFSTAGYRQGRVAIPTYPVSVNVLTFGAVGDGITDNTAAFRKAIRACRQRGAVYVPAGRFVLGDSLLIRKSNVCIRGAGPGNTTLLFSKGLEELYPIYGLEYPNQTSWSWSGAIITFQRGSEVGIEDLTIAFPDNPWVGHDFHERAYNGVGFSGGSHDGWLRNVTVLNADVGFWVAVDSHHITLENWLFDFGPNRRTKGPKQGHHGVNIYGGHNLLQHFELRGKFQHDLSIEDPTSTYNVFRQGKGEDLCIDHHKHDQRKNLFTNVDMGVGSRPYESGGKAVPRGISKQTTFWNLDGQRSMTYCDQFNTTADTAKARDNVAVGVKTTRPSKTPDERGNWFETIDPTRLFPPDLYAAQMAYHKLPMFGDCPIYASSDDGNRPANATDNDLTTRWQARGPNEYLVFCLPAARQIARIKLAFYGGNTAKSTFEVQTSTDGLTWISALKNTVSSGTATGFETFPFLPRPARYVKVIGHGSSGSDLNAIAEVQMPMP